MKLDRSPVGEWQYLVAAILLNFNHQGAPKFMKEIVRLSTAGENIGMVSLEGIAPSLAGIFDLRQLQSLVIDCIRVCLKDLIAQKQTRITKQIPTIEECAAQYIADRLATGHFTEKTASENEAIFNVMALVIGDKPINQLTHEDVAAFRSTLRQLPPNMNKSPKYRDMSIGQILDAAPAKTLSLRSVNKYLTRISSMLSWAHQKGYLRVNPFHRAQIKEKTRPDALRKKLEKSDLEKLFAPIHFKIGSKAAWRFYIMLIALLTGMRLEEICQLECSDIVEVDGIYCFDINENGTKKLKTPASARLIPVHPVLINHFDFLNFVKRQSAIGNRLFPALKAVNQSLGHGYTKWFAEYRKKCSVDQAGKTFHSFRHTVATVWKNSDIPEYISAEILGHTVRSTTYGLYGKRTPVQKMLPIIEQLQFEDILKGVFFG